MYYGMYSQEIKMLQLLARNVTKNETERWFKLFFES